MREKGQNREGKDSNLAQKGRGYLQKRTERAKAAETGQHAVKMDLI